MKCYKKYTTDIRNHCTIERKTNVIGELYEEDYYTLAEKHEREHTWNGSCVIDEESIVYEIDNRKLAEYIDRLAIVEAIQR